MGFDPLSMGMEIGGGLISSISKLFLARKQRQMADAINPVRTYYQTSPTAIENKTLAQNQMNGKMAGADAMERGINTAQAATIGAANRNATSSADALAVAAGSQGTANQGFSQLGAMENAWGQQGLANVMNANRDLTNEGDKVYNDKLLDYNEKTNAKNALLGASLQNGYGGISDFGNGLMSVGMFGLGKRSGSAGLNGYQGNAIASGMTYMH